MAKHFNFTSSHARTSPSSTMLCQVILNLSLTYGFSEYINIMLYKRKLSRKEKVTFWQFLILKGFSWTFYIEHIFGLPFTRSRSWRSLGKAGVCCCRISWSSNSFSCNSPGPRKKTWVWNLKSKQNIQKMEYRKHFLANKIAKR